MTKANLSPENNLGSNRFPRWLPTIPVRRLADRWLERDRRAIQRIEVARYTLVE
jgi:hypothetical protein